jgi:hypothetical protein
MMASPREDDLEMRLTPLQVDQLRIELRLNISF